MLENRSQARSVLWGLDVEGDPGRGNHLAADLAGAEGRALVMRALAALTVLLLIFGLAPVPAAHAESPDKGQTLGILVLAGLLRAASHAEGRSAVEKPKVSLRSAPAVPSRTPSVKSPKPAAKDVQARVELARVPH